MGSVLVENNQMYNHQSKKHKENTLQNAGEEMTEAYSQVVRYSTSLTSYSIVCVGVWLHVYDAVKGVLERLKSEAVAWMENNSMGKLIDI